MRIPWLHKKNPARLELPKPLWAEYPVMIDGIPGFCSLRVPHGTDIEVVKKALRQLQSPRARYHE